MPCPERCLGPGNAAAWLRSDENAGVAGLEGGNTTDDSMHPVGHCPERVVVEARHLSRVDAAVGKHRIPALPDRGGAHGHGIKPRGDLPLYEEPVGVVEVARDRERVGDVWRAREAGLDVMAAFRDQLSQPLPRQLGLLGVEETEDDRQRVDRLGIAGDHSVRADVVPDEDSGFGRQAQQTERRRPLAEDSSCLGNHPGTAVETSGRDHPLVGFRICWLIRGAVGSSQSPNWKP